MTDDIAKVASNSNRGSAPGERRGGRAAGTPNKTTAEIRALAGQYGEAALERLAWLMEHAESEQTQIAAAKELLDRGYGKSTQPVEMDAEVNFPPVQEIQFVVVEPDGTKHRVPGPGQSKSTQNGAATRPYGHPSAD